MMTRARRRWWLAATLVLALTTARPGGAGAQPEPTVGGYMLVGSTRVTRTVFDFTYRAQLTNPLAQRLTGARATLTSLAPATTVIDGNLDFGDVEAGATVTSLDTFTIRQDRTVPFDPAALVWSITYGRAPTANAGPDQTVAVGTDVQLDGSASTDPDGDTLTFRWRLVSVPAGSGATLSDPTALRPTFRVDRGGTYVAELVVRDGALESAPDTVQTSTLNSRPVANAGPDQTVPVGATVVLDGRASADVDLDPLSFRWSFVQRPDGSAASLDDPSAVGPSFIADLPGRYVVRLIVDDGVIDSVPDTVQIDTLNSAPAADAGPDLGGTVGTPVLLDGRGSGDADGDPLTFRWSFTIRPGGSTATFDDPALDRPTFVPDLPGDYVAQLIVNDGALDSVPDTALIAVTGANRPPVANAGPDQTVARGVTVRLDGSGSTDPDRTPLTFAWTLVTRPNTSAATLLAVTTATPTFVADVNGTYVAQLIVSDGVAESAPDTVTITVQDGADLRIFFETPPAATPAVGGTVSFLLRIDNLGPAAVTGVSAHVPIPAGYTFVSSGLGTYDSGTGVWSIPSISASSFGRLSMSLRLLPAGPYDLTATITASSRPDPDLTNNTATAIVTPNPNADLHIFFETPPATTPAVGGTISTLLRISNLGPSATTSVTAHVPMPAGYAFVSAGLGDYDPTTGIWTVPSISASGFGRLSLGLRVLPAGPYDLTATITASSQPDPDPANNTVVAVITPNPNADLHIFVETPPPANATVGGNVGLMFRIDNLGPSATTGVSAHLPIPAGYTLVSSALGTYDSATGIWTIPSLSGSGFGRLALSLRVNATGSMELTGTITGSSQPDPNLANNTVTAPRVNRPPVANAGPDQSVATGITVTLNGNQSSDADGDAITFAWALTQRAANSTATLSGADTAAPSFVPDQPGTYLVQLTVRDSSGIASVPDTVAITAVVMNRPPVILSAPVTAGAVGQPYQHDVRAIDPDAGDTLTFSLPTAPAGMTIAPATGVITWTPADAQGGPQGVTVRVEDQGGLFATQDFAVQVSSPANRAPLADDDAYEVRLSESLSISAPGVLANDTDADGAPLTAQLLEGPANGTLSFNPDGSFTYTPQTLVEGNLVRLSNVNLATRVPGVTVTASSAVSPGPGAAIDDAVGTAWSTGFDAAPFLEIHFPQDVTVSRLELYGSRTRPDLRTGAGILRLFGVTGGELFTTGNIHFPPPTHDVTVHVPSVSGVRRVRLDATAMADGAPLFAASIEELKVFGVAVVSRPPAVAEPNLGRLVPTQVNASSFINPNLPEAVIDESPGTNWFAGSFSAGEFIELVFPVDVTVTEIRAEAARGRPDGFGTSLIINQCTGRFTLFDASGAELFDGGVANVPFQVGHPHGGGIFETYVLTVPSVAGVRRVRWTSAGCVGGSFPPGFDELQVLGTASVTRPPFRLARKFNALVGREVHSTPLVANLTDDNFDGRIDRNDVPDIVVAMESIGNQLTGELKVLSGDDGRELATLGGPSLVSPWAEPAVADIDGDGVPDVVAVHSDGNHLMAFDIAGARQVSGNLAQLLPLTFDGSPDTNNVFPPIGAVDGNLATSWATSVLPAPGVPFFEIGFPVGATVTELQLVGDRAVDRVDFLTGIFQLFAANGTVLFDSGDVVLPAPAHDITLPVPGISGVRRVRFTGTSREAGGAAGIAELRVIGSATLPTGMVRTKWISDANAMPRFAVGNSTLITGAVAIANLDATGPPEIIVGASVFDASGRLLGDGRTLGGTTGGAGLRSAISAVVDLDLDGVPELVAGPTAYRLVNGRLEIAWRRTDLPDGYVAIGNFDDDPFPEIVLVACPPAQFSGGVCAGQGRVYMLNHDGTDAEVWNPPAHGPVLLPGGGQGGAPTIADMDGDGIPEIGVAGAVYYTVFNRDGSVRWKSAIRDRSSNATGSTVFDFDGDGSVEVVYRDELFLRVYRGSDGVLLAKTPISSSTWSEQPVVADVDNDGHADLLVVGDPFIGETSQTGVHVFQDVANQWRRTRRIWNQHSYHVTNVDEDGRVPMVATPHWLVPGLNGFRLNTFIPGESTDQADRFTYQVSDGTLTSNIATVRLAIRPLNSAPRIVSTPITTAAPGVLYTYPAQATDPDAGDILTFSLPTAPTGMVIDPLSGLIRWTATAGQLGSQSVVVRVQDVRGLFALQGYTVQAASPVTVPDVIGQPQASAVMTITGANLVLGSIGSRNSATTPAGAVFSQNPTAGALAAPGSRVDLVVSLGPPPVGTVPNVVGLAQAGAQADITAAGFLLGAVGGQHDTIVPLGVVLAQDPAAGTVAPAGASVSLLASLGRPPGDLDADGDGVTGNQGDCDDTNPNIRPGAVDIAGDGVDQNCNGRDSLAGDDTPPIVAIDSPAEDAVLTMPADVVGSATDANFLRYVLELAPADSTEFRQIGAGTAPVVGGILGQVDPTLLENGMYRVRLTAEDANGQTASVERVYLVDGMAKIGHVRLSFTDLEIPVGGIPITIVRTYDSRVKTREDFGIGWTLDVRRGSFRHNRTPGQAWQILSGSLGLPCQTVVETASHFTQVQLSDFESYRFALTLSSPAALTGGCTATAGFRFVSGRRPGATLEILDGTDVMYLNGDAQVVYPDTFTVYNPARLRLTTPDGRRYDLDRAGGITRIQDPNGNTISITPGGVVHSSGKSVAFVRDAVGRITRIVDPNGSALAYAYDAAGDLTAYTDAAGHRTAFAYDARHNLLEIVDPLGRRPATHEYDADGRLIAVTDASGVRLTVSNSLAAQQQVVTDRLGRASVFEYDVRGNVTRRINALGETTTLTYDDRDNLLTVRDPLGSTRTRAYDASGNVVTAIDALGNPTTFTYNNRNDELTRVDALGGATVSAYDRNGNLTQITDPRGGILHFSYDERGNQTGKTDELGNTWSYAHDAAGNEVRATDPLGNVTTRTFDGNGNVVTETTTRVVGGALEVLTRRYQYDALNRVVGLTHPDGGVETLVYNPTGTIARTTDPLGRVTAYTYDAQDRLTVTAHPDGTTETFTYDAEGRRATRTDRAGRLTRFDYDAVGRLVATTHPDGSIVRFGYDAAGRQLTRTDERGGVMASTYDAAGRLLSTTDPLGNRTSLVRDALGRVVSRTDPGGRATTFAYDAGDQLIRREHPDVTTTLHTYDLRGNLLTETDPAGRITRFAYDARHDLIQVTDPLGATARYTYDEQRRLISAVNPRANVTRHSYDPVGRRLTTSLPLGQVERLAYDAAGNVLSHTDFNGLTTTYTYDEVNRITRRAAPDHTLDYEYTPSGRLARLTDARGTLAIQYDLRDRPLSVRQPDDVAVEYAYDTGGNRVSVTTPAGVTRYTYDAAGQLRVVEDPTGDRTTFDFDAAGNPVRITYANGVVVDHSYDSLDRLTALAQVSPGGPLGSYAYTRNAAGQVLRVTESTGRQVDYAYDEASRLLRETITPAGGGSATTIAYTYDAAGNRLTRTDGGALTTYTYDANDRLLTAGATTFTYDASGNTVAKTTGAATTTYGYDSRGRLVRVTPPSGDPVVFTYDPLDHRVRRDGPAGTTTYLVDPFGAGDLAQVLRQSTNGEPVDYVYAADQLVSHRAGGRSAYHLLDGQRSTRRLTDEAGAITDTYDYDAFGRLLARTGTTPNDDLYNSQYLDSAAGLYYLRARHYDPALGRFLTTDPVPGDPATPATWHRYLYAGGDPVNREDPSGRFFLAGLEAAGRFLQSSLPALGQTLVRTAIRKAAQAGSKQITRTLLEPVAQRIAARIGQQTLRNTVKKELDDLIKAGSKNRRVRCFAAQIAIEIAPEFRKVQTVSSATVGSGLGGVTAAGAVVSGGSATTAVAIVAKILDGPQLQLLLEVLEELKDKYCKDLPDPDLP